MNLPPLRLKRAMQSMAVLDAILCPEWEFRWHSFDAHWDTGEAMGSIRNGSGDFVFVVFREDGVVAKIADHENPTAQQLPESMPAQLNLAISDAAFSACDANYFGWATGETWLHAPETFDFPSCAVVVQLDGEPSTYVEFAADYFECELPVSSVEAIFESQPLSEKLLREISPDCSVSTVRCDLKQIGYPSDL